MKNRRIVLVFLLLVSINLNFNYLLIPIKSHSGDLLNAPLLSYVPIIDGTFNSIDEWNDGVVTHWTSPFEVYLYIKYNSSYLYLCADSVGDTLSNTIDYIYIYFDTDHDGNPTPGHDDAFLMYTFPFYAHYTDGSGAGYDLTYHCDFTSHPGLVGAFSFSTSPNSGSNHRIYEFQIPLALLNVSPGDTLGFGIYVYDWDLSQASFWPSGFISSDLATWSDLVLYVPPQAEFQISNVTHSPLLPSSTDTVEVTANITSSKEIMNASIWYSANESNWFQQIMHLSEGTSQNGIWKGIIPPNPLNSTITFYIEAIDNLTNFLKVGPFNYTISDRTPPELINITQFPAIPSATDMVQINVSLKDTSGIQDVQLLYKYNSSGWTSNTLSLAQGSNINGIWTGSIPPFGNGTVVHYYINASDMFDNLLITPENAPINTYGYKVAEADTTAIPITTVDLVPSTPTYHDNVTISAIINISTEISGLNNLTLCYSINYSSLIYQTMIYSNTISQDLLNFSLILPKFSYSNTIFYNLTSYDRAGNFFFTPTYNFSIQDFDSPTILDLTHTPNRPNTNEPVQVNLSLNEPKTAAGVKNATLYYRVEEFAYFPLESPHPLPDLYTYTWNISISDGIIEAIYFENISLEEGFDYLYIYNDSYGLLDTITGEINRYVVLIDDSIARIQIKTDMVINSWGFFISRIKILHNVHAIPMNLVDGDKYNGIWNATIPAKGNISKVYFICQIFDYANNTSFSNLSLYLAAETNPPVITNINQTPPNLSISTSVEPIITTTIVDDSALHYLECAILQYTTGTTWTNLSMQYLGDSYFPLAGQWSATLPTFPDGTKVTYRILAQDLANNTVISENITYLCDGTAPNLLFAKHFPIQPNYNETVQVVTNLTDKYSTFNGAGIESVIIEYSYCIDYNLESPHPYPDGYSATWIIYFPSAYGIAVHFSQIDLLFGDSIIIRDASNNIIDSIIASAVNYWSSPAYSDNITITLYSDEYGNEFGFIIDQIRIIKNSTCVLQAGSIYDGKWEGVIPTFPFGTEIEFNVVAVDFAGNSAVVHSGSYLITDTYNPKILSYNLSIQTPTPQEDVQITLQILEDGAGIDKVMLYLSTDGGLTWNNIPFENLSADTWTCIIPKQPHNTLVKYYMIVGDKNGNTIRNPSTGYATLVFQSISTESTLFLWILLATLGGITLISVIFYFKSRKTIKQKELEWKMKKIPKYGVYFSENEKSKT
ncbi:MAG: hypothetical protein ACTSQI_13405 [Candidatus Helarchaeota archaeon]